MFGLSSRHPLAPHLEGGGLHRVAHELDYLLFLHPELEFDRFKGCPVLPGHLDDPIELFSVESSHRFLRDGRSR